MIAIFWRSRESNRRSPVHLADLEYPEEAKKGGFQALCGWMVPVSGGPNMVVIGTWNQSGPKDPNVTCSTN